MGYRCICGHLAEGHHTVIDLLHSTGALEMCNYKNCGCKKFRRNEDIGQKHRKYTAGEIKQMNAVDEFLKQFSDEEVIKRKLYYKLDENNNPVPTDLHTFSMMMENGNQVLKQTVIDKILVSTIFLGIDHGFGDGAPILFETMVFINDDPAEDYLERYRTYDEAMEWHEKIVNAVKSGIDLNSLHKD